MVLSTSLLSAIVQFLTTRAARERAKKDIVLNRSKLIDEKEKTVDIAVLFELADRDNSGQATIADMATCIQAAYKEVHKKKPIEKGRLNYILKNLDSDHNGFITREEYNKSFKVGIARAIKRFYAVTNAALDGRYLSKRCSHLNLNKQKVPMGQSQRN